VRTSFILFLLLGLLCLSRFSSLCNSLSQYQIAKALTVLVSLPPAQGIDRKAASESLNRREDALFDLALGAGYEIAVLMGIGLIIYKIRDRIDPIAEDNQKRKHAPTEGNQS